MKINIVGGGYGNELAPTTGNVWGFNDWQLRGYASVIFHMHNLPEMLAKKNVVGRGSAKNVKATLKKARETNVIMYSLDTWHGCLKYPLEEISEKFQTDYFTSGVAYAIALAIHQGVSQLHLYGISLVTSPEYRFQKPCVEFWLGIAKGMGIEVFLFGKGEVLRSASRRLYGYNTKQGELNWQTKRT